MSLVWRKQEFGQTLHRHWLSQWDFWYQRPLNKGMSYDTLTFALRPPRASAIMILSVDSVFPQWSYCLCTWNIRRIKQPPSSRCQVVIWTLPVPPALCLFSEDCSWPSFPEIATVSVGPFIHLSHFTFILTEMQLYSGSLSERNYFPNPQVFAARRWCTLEITAKHYYICLWERCAAWKPGSQEC